MRRLVFSLVVLLEIGSAGIAQQDLRGVYGPPPGAPGQLGGVYGSPQESSSSPGGLTNSLPNTVTAPDYGPVGSGPQVSVAGTPRQGDALPTGVRPSPIPGRPGYGAAVVNGHRVIVDRTTRRIYQILD